MIEALPLSANLGFLWTDLSLPEAVRAAHRAGFAAVELHWPYGVPAEDLRAALEATGLPVLAINTPRGDVAAGDFGLAALSDRRDEARAGLRQALDYARGIGAANIHVMAGRAQGASARQTFVDTLREARDLAAPHGIGLLVEPLNSRDVPGYFLACCDMAADVIAACGGEGIRILFDCYHMQIMRGDLLHEVTRLLPLIGHIQFAAVPDRQEPDHGEVDFAWLLPALRAAGYAGFFGAEYRPRGATDAGLAWMARFAGRG
ncbi:hydroxypyruvate isomerase family protein [Polymorphum gilvum]|uniref:Hydroxypyruvate isomerase, putative n=1 Tax=Polymorphum gilvum (strain LMG 25793 / CGMCC 1.9160 / SL003B-26A1) TaxID=991905 RepID=F2IZK6_POLGS|nr:TIM barrel protein [Polymorphum gilvum]ADZ69563.1 Hydroxypyruvate isomerase, putative [Polymorphum gilvum SL003B-26A1]